MSAAMHTCDLDWGRTVVLMLWLLLMLRLRLWEDVSDWVGPIRSNRSVEAGAAGGAAAGAKEGAATAGGAAIITLANRSAPPLSAAWADAGIWPPGKAFHSPKSPLLLEACAAATGHRENPRCVE